MRNFLIFIFTMAFIFGGIFVMGNLMCAAVPNAYPAGVCR